MNRQFTYKKKIKIACLAGFFALVICYRFSIANTIEQYRQYTKEIAAVDTLSENQSVSIESLNVRENEVDRILGEFILDTIHRERNILSVSSNYCKMNGLELREYRPLGISEINKVKIFNCAITIQGPFVKCLRLVNELETSKRISKVKSVEFKSYKDSQDKATRLICMIYLQNLISR
jgi:hypothetical protein